MRYVTITKDEFEKVVYPVCAAIDLRTIVGAQETDQWRRILYNLLNKLEDAGSPLAEDVEAPLYRIDNDVTFEFDPREADLLSRYIKFATDGMAPVRARIYQPLIKRCAEGDAAVDAEE